MMTDMLYPWPQAAAIIDASRIIACFGRCNRKSRPLNGLKTLGIRAMIDKYTEDIAVNSSLIQKELGFVPQYDLKTGWEETIKEMRRENSFTF